MTTPIPDWLEKYTLTRDGVGLRESQFIQKTYDYSRKGEQFLYDLSKGGRMWINARFTDEAQNANRQVFMAIMGVIENAKSTEDCRNNARAILELPYVRQVLGESCGYDSIQQAMDEIVDFCVRHNSRKRAMQRFGARCIRAVLEIWPFADPEERIHRLRARNDVKGLIALFQSTKTEHVAASVARALGEIGDPNSADVLLDAVGKTIIRGDEIWDMDLLRRMVTEALIMMGPPVTASVAHAMEKYAKAEEWLATKVTDEVMVCLGHSGAGALIALSKHTDRNVRAHAVRVLGNMLDQVICAVLYTVLVDKYPDVAKSVQELGPAGIMAVRAICKPLGIPVEASICARVLGEKTYQEMVDALKTALQDPDSWVSKTAQESLSTIQGEG